MKVLIYGHSYVRDLHQKCSWEEALPEGRALDITYEFRYFPGKDFEYILNKPGEFDDLAGLNPDIIVVVLGGNSITFDKTNNEIKDLMHCFYKKLNDTLPRAIKLAVQIEPRFCLPGNRHGAPEAEEFNRRRQVLNNFVNKTIKKNGLVDHMVLLGSTEYLNHHQFFRDGVHLSGVGLVRYQAAIQNTVQYAVESQH